MRRRRAALLVVLCLALLYAVSAVVVRRDERRAQRSVLAARDVPGYRAWGEPPTCGKVSADARTWASSPAFVSRHAALTSAVVLYRNDAAAGAAFERARTVPVVACVRRALMDGYSFDGVVTKPTAAVETRFGALVLRRRFRLRLRWRGTPVTFSFESYFLYRGRAVAFLGSSTLGWKPVAVDAQLRALAERLG